MYITVEFMEGEPTILNIEDLPSAHQAIDEMSVPSVRKILLFNDSGQLIAARVRRYEEFLVGLDFAYLVSSIQDVGHFVNYVFRKEVA